MIVLDGAGLTPAVVLSAARDREPVALSERARERNLAARAEIAALLARGEPLYGGSTGVGALRDRQILEPDRERFQWSLLRSHAVSAGPPLEQEIVRAGMVVRANQLGAGGAGVAPELLDGLIEALNGGLTPLTRQVSSLGTGDLGGLSEIALAILGEGRAWRDGELIDTPSPSVPASLGLRDALGFISSNAITIGHAALLSQDVASLHDARLAVAALSFEALGADQVVLSERVQAGRGSPGQSAVAARMRELLAGSTTAQRSRLVQDPYPFRVLPQVDGVCAGALAQLDDVLARELNARTENALIEDGRAWPNGNFHAADLGAALDGLRAALAQSTSLIAARFSVLLDPVMTGLSPFLAREPGIESGAMVLEYVVQAAAAEARSLASPMAAQIVTASLGVESHASLADTSARRTAEVLSAMRITVASELIAAMRAVTMAGVTPAGAGTRELHALASRELPSGLEDRSLSGDVELALGVLERWSPTTAH
jgi:histidine ammonia-lyase